MFFPLEIMLQPREMDHCLREIYNFQRELYNFCGNWVIASGNFPFAVGIMIFPVGDELFLIGNYPFPMSEDPSLVEILVFLKGKMFFRWEMNFFSWGKGPQLTEIIKFPWKLAAHLQEKGLRLWQSRNFQWK